MKQVIIIKKNRGYSFKGSSSIASIAEFLTTEIRSYYRKQKEELINEIIGGKIGFEVYDIEIIDGQIHFTYDFYGTRDESQDFTLSPEQLKYILYKWWELTEADYEEIIITEHDDGNYVLEGRNPEPVKEEKKLSFFQQLSKKIFRR